MTQRIDDEPDPIGSVLVLHGGTDQPLLAELCRRSSRLSAAMKAPRLAKAVARRLAGRRVAVWTLEHDLAFWDDTEPATPVHEAREALDQIARDLGASPVVLVGYSMGGRTAVAAADHENVRGVVALAPWLPPTQPAWPLSGRALRVARAQFDHICPSRGMQDFLLRAATVTDDLEEPAVVAGDTHWLWRVTRWADFAASAVEDLIGITSPAEDHAR